MPRKPVKTETVVRQYDNDDRLISETTTVVTETPVSSNDDRPGMYL